MGDQGYASNDFIYPVMVQSNDAYTVIDVKPIMVKQPQKRSCETTHYHFNWRNSFDR